MHLRLSPFLLLAAPAMAQAPSTIISAGDLAGRPVYEGSTQRRVLLDAGQPGAPVFFLDIPAGARVPPHGHTQEDLVVLVVVRGPVLFADGGAFDSAALRPYPAGSVLLLPRSGSHFLEGGPEGALLFGMPARRENLPPEIARRLPPR